MNKTLVVAQWEYVEKVRSKAFLIGLFLTPMIIVAMGVLPGLLADKENETTKVIGIVDATGELAQPLARRMERYTLSNGQPNYLTRFVAVGTTINLPAAIRDADSMVERGELDGYILLDLRGRKDTTVEYRSKTAGDIRLVNRLGEHVRNILSERRLIARGIDPSILDDLRVPIELRTVKIAAGEQEETDFVKTFFSAYIFIMAMFFLIFTSGQLLVRSVLEEKSNRIVEVLVSSCTPKELMFGKVLGLSAMGLTQMAFWALIALAVLGKVGSTAFPPVEQILLMVVFFILGYLFYSAIFIAFGSPVTTEQEAQQLNGYLVLFVILPVALVLPVMQHPDADWVKVLTFIPLLTPTFMALRIPVQMPSTGEILGAIALLIAATYLMMIAAGRIFRVAILATGKRPSLAEIWSWVREG
ncbi:MAG: hypothetical protein C4326_10345 [Ignavibacteria bacterium]